MKKSLMKRFLSPLAPSNSKVQAIAKQLGWRSETAIARVKKALPAPLEQGVFVSLVSEARLGMYPESFAEVLRFFAGKQELEEKDLEDIIGPEGYVHNRFEEVVDDVAATMNILGKFDELGIRAMPSALTAARLVFAYGEEGAEGILELVENNLHSLMDSIGLKGVRIHPAMAIILNEIAATSAGANAPNALSEEEIINLMCPGIVNEFSEVEEGE